MTSLAISSARRMLFNSHARRGSPLASLSPEGSDEKMATSVSLTVPTSFLQTPKSRHFPQACKLQLQFTSSALLTPISHSKRSTPHPFLSYNFSRRSSNIWRICATPEDVVPPETTIQETQQIIPPDDGAGSTIISVLLFIAFVVLTVLTIGVIYIAVTDFLQKRERDKYEKEEAAQKKKGGKKPKVKARAGPRGFGQKIEDDDD